MNEMLTEHLDLKYDETVLPRKPNRLQEEVLIDPFYLYILLE